MIERINFWGIPHTLPFIAFAYVILPLCAVFMLTRVYQRIRLWWKVGRPEPRWDQPVRRFGRLIKYGLIQVKVLRQTYPGLMHAAIAWGFTIFFLGTAVATIDADFVKFLRGNIYLIFKVVLDVFTVIALVGIAVAAFRRFIQKPERLTKKSRFTFALTVVFLIVLTGLVTESLRLAAIKLDPSLQPGWDTSLAWWTPAGWVVAQIWLGAGLTVQSLNSIHLVTWLAHGLLAGLLFVTLPTGSMVHAITASLNVFFSKLDRPVALAPALQREGGLAGVASLRDFTWKQLMDGDACTECGRCQDACPAHASGASLSPKEVILSIRDALATDGPKLAATNGNGNGQVPEFTGEAVKDAVAWSCATCAACVAECPVLVEHIDAIVDMRRYLLTQQRADQTLVDALNSFRRYGNSFAKSDRQRAKWITGLDAKPKDLRKKPAKTLWFVGDYASYSPTLTTVTQTTARVFEEAGIDYGILYDGERNSGNDIRRVGEEGLFEMLALKNQAVLDKCQFEEIVTTDPHTYNTLKNEYGLPEKGIPVYHYAEVLDRAIREGTLRIRTKLGYTVTYHDPCYLGRYNQVYDAPRRVLEAIGCRVVEMPRNRDRALCCGAGGGRIWMDELETKERPSENRIREAGALDGVQYFVVACPKDLTMYRDAVKTAGFEERIAVKDLIELVEEALWTEVDFGESDAKPVGAAS